MSDNFIHSTSDVQSKQIGAGTKIWQFCVILPKAKIGMHCNINAQVFIENDVEVGNNVTVKCGVQLWDGLRIGNNVFIGPNTTFTNDPFPRSKKFPEVFAWTIINDGASIGANSTILPGITIGSNAMVGAGSVVTRSVPANAIVVGNPAIIIGYVDTKESRASEMVGSKPTHESSRLDLGVSKSALFTLPLIPDLRGSLSVAEYGNHVPFMPKRCFWVFGVPNREVRGEHAHKACHQYLICVKGSVHVVLDDSDVRTEVILDKPNLGLYIPPGVWGIQYKYSADAVLFVLASEKYDADDYLRNYDDFCAFVRETRQQS